MMIHSKIRIQPYCSRYHIIQIIVETSKSLIEMPSTRKQKAREKRSRQSGVLSDIENLDVMLGNYTNSEIREQEAVDQIEIDPESRRRQQDLDQNEGNYRSLLNTNLSENSEITVETSRMINSEISSQMSRKIEEMKSDLNSHILEVINSAIEEKILPSIENVFTSNREAKNTKWDLRSDGRHPDRNIQMTQNSDLESHGRHKTKFCQQVQDLGENFPKLIATSSNQSNHRRENLVAFEQSDDDGYDMVTGANLTPHLVPEFLTGRPMQSRNTIPLQNPSNDDTLGTTLPAQQNPNQINNQETPHEPPVDPINCLADVIMGMNNKQPSQTLMLRPVSRATLTFDGKSEKFELFEDLFHTMTKMQPDMTETMKITHFHSLLRKSSLQTFRNINSANRQTLEDILAVFRRKYVKPESQTTAKHKWHKLVIDPNTMKLPDFLEELNQGPEKAFGEHAQAMIDSLLYAKLPPKLKRYVNMARLEDATYEEIVTHLERELELNGLEEGDDIHVPTMSTAPQQHDRQLASFHLALTRRSLVTIAKNRGMSKMTAENSRERRNKSAMVGRIRRKNIPNVQLATKRITRRNGVGKALEPTSSPKTSNWIIPKPRKLP